MTTVIVIVLAPVVLAFLVASFREPMRVALPMYALTIPFGSGVSVGLPGPFGTLSSVLGLVLGVALLAQLVTVRAGAVRLAAPIPLWLAFLALCGASAFWSVAPQATATSFLVLTSLVLLYVLVAVTGLDRAVLTRVENALVLGGALSAVYGLAQLTVLGGLPIRDNGTTPRFGNDLLGPNNQAVSLLLPFAIALGRLAVRSGRGRLVFGAAAAVLAVGILLTGSRGGLLAAVLAYGAVVVLGREGRRVLIRFGLVGVVLMVGVLAVNPGGVGERQVNADDTSGRAEIWAVGLYSCPKYCLIGAGWGGFPTVYKQERAAVLEARVLRRGTAYEPHNIWMLVALETGILGILLVGAVLVITTAGALRLPPSMRGPPVAAIAGILLAGFFLSNVEFKFFWMGLMYVVLCQNVAAMEAVERRLARPVLPVAAT